MKEVSQVNSTWEREINQHLGYVHAQLEEVMLLPRLTHKKILVCCLLDILSLGRYGAKSHDSASCLLRSSKKRLRSAGIRERVVLLAEP